MSSRDRSLIAIIVLLIIAVGGYFIVVEPAHQAAKRLDGQITAAQSSLAAAESQVQAGQAAEAEYRQYAAQLKSIKRAVPGDEQIPLLINELQAASNQNKVGFQSVTASGGSATPGSTTSATTNSSSSGTFPSDSYNLSFTGNYFAVANLLGTLASFVHADDKHFKASGRLITIGSLSLAPGSGARNGEVTASVTAVDYAIPTSLTSSSSTATSTGTPAADITTR